MKRQRNQKDVRRAKFERLSTASTRTGSSVSLHCQLVVRALELYDETMELPERLIEPFRQTNNNYFLKCVSFCVIHSFLNYKSSNEFESEIQFEDAA